MGSVLLLDGFTFCTVTLLFASVTVEGDRGGLPWGTVAWIVVFAAVFGGAAFAMLARPGVDGTRFGLVLGWVIAMALPMGAYIADGLWWSSGGAKPVGFTPFAATLAALQMLMPAAVRWARNGVSFGRAYLEYVVLLGALLLGIYFIR